MFVPWVRALVLKVRGGCSGVVRLSGDSAEVKGEGVRKNFKGVPGVRLGLGKG